MRTTKPRFIRTSGARLVEVLLVCLVFGSSLWLRLSALDAFPVVDEPKWVQRSANFYNALATGQLEKTYQREHPGVVNMWMGVAGTVISSLRQYGRPCPELTVTLGGSTDACAPGLMTLMVRMRVMVATSTWLICLAAYGLLRKLYSAKAALLTAPLLALDPFFLAHSRSAHMDGFLAGAMLLSLLGVLAHVKDGRKRWLVLSGVAAGLAMAEKMPGWFCVPVAVALLILSWRRGPGHAGSSPRRFAAMVIIWGAAAVGTLLLLWPAMATAPVATVSRLYADLTSTSEAALEHVHLFWGSVTGDPGIPFYLVALALRLSPLTLIGLVVAIVMILCRPVTRSELLPWLSYALGFLLIMATSAKKADRYLLPSFPAVDVLSGLALLRGADWLAGRWPRWRQKWVLGTTALFLTVQVASLVPLTPYALSYYNWLVGGPLVAPRMLEVGYGEGLDQAADYLNQKANAPELLVATWYREVVEPLFVGMTRTIRYPRAFESDYLVFYINQLQREKRDEVFEAFASGREPEHVVVINQIEYAYIYANPEPFEAMTFLGQNGRSDDLIICEIASLFTRYYQGNGSLWVVPGWDDEAKIVSKVNEMVSGRERVWLVTYPEYRGLFGQEVEETLLGQLCASISVEMAPVRITLYQACRGSDP